MKTLLQRCFSVVAIGLAAVASASAQTASASYFLKVEGVPGESQNQSHPNEIEIVSFSLGVEQRGISDFGGGAGARKSSFKPFVIQKRVDKASPLLLLACATGKHIPKVSFTARNDAESLDYLVITLTDVLVSSLEHVSAQSDGVDMLLESVSFNFAKIEFKYVPQAPTGGTLPPVIVGFDLKTNKTISTFSQAPQ